MKRKKKKATTHINIIIFLQTLSYKKNENLKEFFLINLEQSCANENKCFLFIRNKDNYIT